MDVRWSILRIDRRLRVGLGHWDPVAAWATKQCEKLARTRDSGILVRHSRATIVCNTHCLYPRSPDETRVREPLTSKKTDLTIVPALDGKHLSLRLPDVIVGHPFNPMGLA